MTPLDELRRLEAAATPGPWTGLPGSIAHSDPAVNCKRWAADAELIPAMRNALPALLDEIAELRAALTGRTVSCGACEKTEAALRAVCSHLRNEQEAVISQILAVALKHHGLWRDPP